MQIFLQGAIWWHCLVNCATGHYFFLPLRSLAASVTLWRTLIEDRDPWDPEILRSRRSRDAARRTFPSRVTAFPPHFPRPRAIKCSNFLFEFGIDVGPVFGRKKGVCTSCKLRGFTLAPQPASHSLIISFSAQTE